jgi:steroid 5-alpha reductase family enzyme
VTWGALLVVWALAALAMTGGWLWQKRRDNAGIVDVIWACGVGASAVLVAVLGEGALLPRLLLGGLGGLWGLRLAAHLWKRVRREDEDGRYAYLRAHWHGHQGKFFLFFQFQALLIVLFSLPFVAVAANPDSSLWLLGAVLVWLVSVGGESVADRQLADFRADPGNKGKTCRDGLWAYSRHPNYFFEWLHWLTYVVLAIGSPLLGWAFAGPVVMYLFLRYVSGIPFTEQQALRTRGDDYRDYQRSTPMLFPWFPKSDSNASTGPQR